MHPYEWVSAGTSGTQILFFSSLIAKTLEELPMKKKKKKKGESKKRDNGEDPLAGHKPSCTGSSQMTYMQTQIMLRSAGISNLDVLHMDVHVHKYLPPSPLSG